MDDNIWEYPFGELDDDDDMFYREPETDKTSDIIDRKELARHAIASA